MAGPDLWWGSSAYRAEPAGSSSVGKPAPRGNLRPKNYVKHHPAVARPTGDETNTHRSRAHWDSL